MPPSVSKISLSEVEEIGKCLLCQTRPADRDVMRNFLLFTTLLLALGPAHAEGSLDSCQKALESLSRSREIPFQFEAGTRKMKNASSYDMKSNPRSFKNKDGVTLSVHEKDGRPSKYVLTHEKNCERRCDHLTLDFELKFINDECKVQRAHIKDDLNERTLWTSELCEELQKGRLPTGDYKKFEEKNPDWMKKYGIKRKIFQTPDDVLSQIYSNCRRYDEFYSAPVKPATGPAAPSGGAASKTQGGSR